MQQARPIGSFRQLTRQNSLAGTPITYNAFGGAAQVSNLPRAGWLAKLFLYISGSITTGAGTPAGGWPAYPMLPWSLLGRVRVFTNTNTDIVNMSGHGLYLFNRFLHYLGDPQASYNTWNNASNLTATLATVVGGTTPPASTATNFAGWLEVPIATDDALFLGALFLQSDQLTLGVEVTPPNAADVSGNITGVTLTPNITIRPQAIFYDQPADPRIVPNTQYAHILREDIRQIGVVGSDIQFALPFGNTYMRIAGMLENGGSQISQQYINSVGLRYMQTVQPYSEDYRIHIVRNRSYLGECLPDGMFLWDMTWGSGIPGLVDSRDLINSSHVTDFQALVNLSSNLSLNNARCRLFTEQLAAIGGPS